MISFVLCFFTSVTMWFTTTIPFIANLLGKEILKLSVVYPKTETFKELKSKPLCKIKYDSTNEKILYEQLKNINLQISGINTSVELVLRSLMSNKQEFFIDQIDTIVISKMGIEVVEVSMGERGFNRSLFLELTGYCSSYLNWRIFLTLVTFGLTLLGENLPLVYKSAFSSL